MSDLKYNASYINALSEVRDPKLLFEWVCKLHRENVDLREEIDTLRKRYNFIVEESKIRFE